MTWQPAALTTAGALVGFGLWSLLSPGAARAAGGGQGPSVLDRALRGLSGPDGVRILVAVAAGVGLLLVTRWVAVAVGVGGVIAVWPKLFGAAAEQRVVIARLESLAAWVESLRDIIATGRALPEALPAASCRPYPELDRAMADVVSRMGAHEPMESVLRRMADDVDDPVADRVIAALILNARVQGRALRTVLTGLAISTRREVDTRRQVEAERRKVRRGTQIVLIAVVVMAVAMSAAMPNYSEAYKTLTGQVVLGVVVSLFLGGLAWMRTLSRHRTPERFLVQTQPAVPGVHLAACYVLPTTPRPRASRPRKSSPRTSQPQQAHPGPGSARGAGVRR